MYNRTRTRLPRGAYVELKSKEVLRAMVHATKKTNRKFANDAGMNHATLDLLLSTGKAGRMGCSPLNAEKIAAELGVPLEVLFVVHLPEAVAQPRVRQAMVA